MKILQGDQVPIDSWTVLLEKSPFSSPFQTPEYYNLFKAQPYSDAEVIALDEHGQLEALCVITLQFERGLKSYFSRRAIIYGGPLLYPVTGSENISILFKAIEKRIQYRSIYLEIRNYFDLSSFSSSLQKTGFEYTPWLNFQLVVSDLNQVLTEMSNSRSRQIKKAIRQGVKWKVAENKEEIVVFYSILKRLYSEKIKKPLFPLDFFLRFFNSKLGVFLLIMYQGKIIGGIVCPVLKEKSLYEFYVCGLDQEYKEQYPSVMATWAAIEYGNQNRISFFDFMGAGSPVEKYGVREFKSRFGGTLVEYGRYIKILNPILYFMGKTALKILSMKK
jgi:serine/alanine adding enzyme